MPRYAVLVAALPLLAACAANTADYPSLAKHPAERISGTAPVVTPESPAPVPASPPSPELAARLDGFLAKARAAHAVFGQKESRARALTSAARGAAVASERWSVATVALAELESARSEAMIALADLDALYAATRIAGDEAGAIGAARDTVIGLVMQEDSVLSDLRGQLRF